MKERVSRAVDVVLGGLGRQPLRVKVPQITALFWVTKITSTAMGEALADWLDGPNSVVLAGVGAVVALVAFVLGLRLQFRTRRYTTPVYWFAVAMVATFGTMVADAPHQFLGVPYGAIVVFYAVVLALVFWRWKANEGTLSIHTVDTRQREKFYWGTVVATFALGTATGDWTAGSLHLGFLFSGLLFTALIGLPALGYRWGLNEVGTFWTAYVLTRPLGASFADWFDYPHTTGGLGVGTAPVWIALALVMTALVWVLNRRDKVDHRTDFSAASGERTAPDAAA